jgi:ketosteroid isomerase-like protein
MTTTVAHNSIARAVLAYYAHIDRGDVDAALTCFAVDAIYHRPGYEPFSGIAAIRAYYLDTRVIGTGAHRIHDVVYNDTMVAVRGSFCGESRSGEPLAVGFSDFWEFAGDMVSVRRTFFDAPAV